MNLSSHSLLYTPIHLCIYPSTPSLAHVLIDLSIHSLAHTLTCALIHPLTPFLADSSTHPLTCAPFPPSLISLLSRSLTCPSTHLLTHPSCFFFFPSISLSPCHSHFHYLTHHPSTLHSLACSHSSFLSRPPSGASLLLECFLLFGCSALSTADYRDSPFYAHRTLRNTVYKEVGAVVSGDGRAETSGSTKNARPPTSAICFA